MKKTILGLAGIIALLSALNSQAAQETHAGHAIVCYTDSTKIQISSIEMEDYYEGANTYTNKLDLGPPSMDYKVLVIRS